MRSRRDGLRREARGLNPGYIAPVMATGIGAKAMRLDGAATLSGVLLAAAIIAYLVLVVACAWRLARYWEEFLADTPDRAGLSRSSLSPQPPVCWPPGWLVTLGSDEAWVAQAAWVAVARGMARALSRRLAAQPDAQLLGAGSPPGRSGPSLPAAALAVLRWQAPHPAVLHLRAARIIGRAALVHDDRGVTKNGFAGGRCRVPSPAR